MFTRILVPDLSNIILKGNERIKLLELLVADPTQSHGYNFTFNSQTGKIDAIHNDEYVYDLPFETNKEYKLLQGYGGKFSHSDERNYFAYDCNSCKRRSCN